MSHHMTLPTTSLASGLAGQASPAKRGLTAKDATAPAGSTSGTSSSSAAANSTSSLDTTFLSLLVQELQNQDPTAPMDSTAMVGQMISLNQLDQLTSINQTLNTAYGSSGTTSGATSGTTSGTTAGASSGTTSGTSTQAHALSATQAALQLLSSTSTQSQKAVSPSVSLPAF